MRCTCCNKLLTDYEATRRHGMTKDFLDMCADCFGAVGQDVPIPFNDRPDLWGEYDSVEDFDCTLDDMEEL